jgi:hypothetical protein
MKRVRRKTHKDPSNNWIAHSKTIRMFCKLNGPCVCKYIKKAKLARLYWVLCTNDEGCNQKTFKPKTIDFRPKRGQNKLV